MTIPKLRDRREDILLLLLHALGAPTPRLTPALAEALLLHAWPFNVRELLVLASQIRIRAGLVAGGAPALLDIDLVADRLARPTPGSSPPGEERVDISDKEPPPDRAALETLLVTHRGVVADVARTMRRSRKQVYRCIADHRLDVAHFRG